ncbi:MAG: CHASE2 domain-containing protein [Saprospiraceae bacterium]|nr:CHASE2 domain-containing protein [Saprospiraceae bacterium]
MWRKLIYPHSLIVTGLVFLLIGVLDFVRINAHFLNPFKETIRDYEVTDIVYSKLRDHNIVLDNHIVLVNTGKPDRDTMRMVVDRLVEAGAKVVALDVLLEGRKNPRTDSLLRAALTRIENVVLATELDAYSDDDGKFKMQVGCDTFFGNYVYSGFINFISKDSNSTIRYFSPLEMTTEGECLSFPVQVAKLYDPQVVERLFQRDKKLEEIYYTGNGDQFVQYESKDILNPAIDLKKQIQGKIVLVGFLGTYAWDKPMLDRHYTPLNERYTGRNTPDMYGMVIHANIIQMMLNNTYVSELSPLAQFLLTLLFGYLNIHLLYQIFRRVSTPFHFVTRFLQLGEIIILFFIVAWMFRSFRVKLDVAYWIAALALAFDVIKFYDNVIRKRVPQLSKIPYQLTPPPRKPAVIKKTAEKPAEETSSEKELPPDGAKK